MNINLFHNKITHCQPHEAFYQKEQKAPETNFLDPGDKIFFIFFYSHHNKNF
jgi:hypothetical protein